VLSVKEMEYVTAARALGTRERRILFRHVLPNTLAPIIVQVSLALSWALLTEAGLSFLGLGTQPPNASWGVMLSESRGIAEIAPWLMIYPGIAIMLGVLGFNLLGDGLRDTLDPRMRGRD
jgi:peptide/nickel transport system permease protein